MIFNDKPITTIEQDDLNREIFVDAIVKQITYSKNESGSIIYGIYGSWGSGKSSVLQILDKKISQKPHYYFTTFFNPWRYGSEDILIIELFNKIIEGCRAQKNDGYKKIGKILKKYSKYAKVKISTPVGVSVDIGSPIQGVLYGLGELFERNKSLEVLKAEINIILENLALPLVIIVDDIDRLEKKDIQALFRLIKLTADFTKLRYILSFDEEKVAEAIGSQFGKGTISDGYAFLEKIVQIPIRMPEISNYNRFQFTLKLLNKWQSEVGFNYSQDLENNFIACFRKLHDQFIKTPRDSKRLINSCQFLEVGLRGEINILDVIILETVRIFIPSLFTKIVDFKSSFLILPRHEDLSSNFLFKELDKLSQSELVRLRQNIFGELGIDGKTENLLYNTINYLFPENQLNQGSFSKNNTEADKNYRKDQRVAIYQYFSRYLELQYGQKYISDIELERIIKEINSRKFKDLNQQFSNLYRYERNYINALIETKIPELTYDGKINFAIFILSNSPSQNLKPFENFLEEQITLSFGKQLIFSISNLSKRKDAIFTIIRFIENYAQKFIFLTFCLNQNSDKPSESFSKEENRLIRRLFENVLSDIYSLPVEEWISNFPPGHHFNDLLEAIIEEKGPRRRNKLINYSQKSHHNTFSLFRHIIPPAFVNGKLSYWHPKAPNSDHFKLLTNFFDPDFIKESMFKQFPEFQNQEKLPSLSTGPMEFDLNQQFALRILDFLGNVENDAITSD